MHTFEMGSEVSDQQLSCLWRRAGGDSAISVSLSGNINYLDPRAGSIVKVVQGHNRPITAIQKVDPNTLYTGDSEGRVIKWNVSNHGGEGRQVQKAKNIGKCVNSGFEFNVCDALCNLMFQCRLPSQLHELGLLQ